MASPVSYNNDKVVTGEVEYPATDPASGAFFQPDFKKNEDLKMMLDGSRDAYKLEAMKRIIGMIAKGRDASDLFPSVVKNVVSKNIEVKKLVYVYLVRYAEEQQDLALLSISTFQRALKDPNQLIRASALRVLSSIRVSMIVPIVMLAIKDSASDMSPYVRKTAAHAIPKLYSLDPDQKEELVEIIERLLSDKAPLVVGSAAMAFTEVCPERLSLLHNCYRKLCGLLADVDEWGQCALLNVLTVYAKSHFPDPNKEIYTDRHAPLEELSPCGDRLCVMIFRIADRGKPALFTHAQMNYFKQTTMSTDSSEQEFYSDEEEKRTFEVTLDPDLKLLLRAAKPLLQSRSAAVVVCVARLFYHCANSQELPPMVKALIRLLRAPVEVQSVVLNSIASLTVSKKHLFEPYIKSFYVRMSDPSHIKLVKLEILTNLTSEVNASQVLRELQTYVASSDRVLAANAIQAIGRAALAVPSETQSCLNASLHLLSSKHEWAVCEAVLVVKRVLGTGDASARAALVRATRLLRTDRLSGKAKAAALWLVSEHGAKHPRAAAVLAHMANTFADQDELVKLQLLTLMGKVSITQPETIPLAKYILQLAKYDASYDVRDRARMLAKFVSEDEKVRAKAARVLLAKKPPPNCDSQFTDRQQFTLGTLSHYIGSSAVGYMKLPESPDKVIAADLRDTDSKTVPQDVNTTKKKTFYSEPESSGSESGSGSESSSEDESDSESGSKGSSDSETSDSESDSESSSESSENEEDDKPQPDVQTKIPVKVPSKSDKSNLELLLELDNVATTLPTMTPTCGGFFTPNKPMGDDIITPCAAPFTPYKSSELLSKVSHSNLSATSRFTRAPHLYSNKMVAIEIEFYNYNKEPVNNIRVNKKTLTGTRAIHDFSPIQVLDSNASVNVIFGVDFSDSIQPIEFTIASSLGEFNASITPPVGELMRSVIMSEHKWDKEQNKLRGMNECDKKCKVLPDVSTINEKILEIANVAIVTDCGDLLRYSGQMMCSQELVLLSVKMNENDCLVRANCGNMAVASMLANQVARVLEANT